MKGERIPLELAFCQNGLLLFFKEKGLKFNLKKIADFGLKNVFFTLFEMNYLLKFKRN